jgi:hypothetical protein
MKETLCQPTFETAGDHEVVGKILDLMRQGLTLEAIAKRTELSTLDVVEKIGIIASTLKHYFK